MVGRGPSESNVLVILFPGFNTLDVNGPYETLRSVKYGDDNKEMFKVTVAAEKTITTSAEGMKIERNVALNQALIDNVGAYDILIVPGGPVPKVREQLKIVDSPFNKIIKAYSTLHPRSDSNQRFLLSICTGALFLAQQSVFNGGRYCTTHWAAYADLQEINNTVADLDSTSDIEGKGTKVQPGVVIPARFVDSGMNQQQIQIISSGGISCGIDASLYVVKLRGQTLAGNGEAIAAGTAKLLDYPYRFTEGVVFDTTF